MAATGRWVNWHNGGVEGRSNYHYAMYVECADGYRTAGADNKEACNWRTAGSGNGYPFICVQNCGSPSWACAGEEEQPGRGLLCRARCAAGAPRPRRAGCLAAGAGL